MASSDLLYITDAAILEPDLSVSKRAAGCHECPEQYEERTCWSTSDSFVLFLTSPVLLIMSFFFSTYLTSAMYFCLSFVPVSCYTLIIPYSLLNPFGLRWVYFNKLGLSQRWEEEEVYFGWVSCWESEHKCVVLRWKQQRQAHGYISSLTNSVYQFSYPLACLILLWAFKQTKVTADSSRFTGHTRLPSATNNPPPPGSSAFIVSLFAFSPS